MNCNPLWHHRVAGLDAVAAWDVINSEWYAVDCIHLAPVLYQFTPRLCKRNESVNTLFQPLAIGRRRCVLAPEIADVWCAASGHKMQSWATRNPPRRNVIVAAVLGNVLGLGFAAMFP